MEILYWQKLGLPGFEPFELSYCLTSGAVPVEAGVINRNFRTTAFALVQMSAKLGCAALKDVPHSVYSLWIYAVGSVILPPMFPEHVRHPNGGGHGYASS
jgi:hypothetical protein